MSQDWEDLLESNGPDCNCEPDQQRLLQPGSCAAGETSLGARMWMYRGIRPKTTHLHCSAAVTIINFMDDAWIIPSFSSVACRHLLLDPSPHRHSGSQERVNMDWIRAGRPRAHPIVAHYPSSPPAHHYTTWDYDISVLTTTRHPTTKTTKSPFILYPLPSRLHPTVIKGVARIDIPLCSSGKGGESEHDRLLKVRRE